VDTVLIIAQGIVVIGAILLGVRTGVIGLGLWGLVGLAILVFIFRLPPGDPPTSSMLIILAVITAASTMQSIGGIDYLVEVAKKILRSAHNVDRRTTQEWPAHQVLVQYCRQTLERLDIANQAAA
jgi:anaerobic C4-dicarboxylate transporter